MESAKKCARCPIRARSLCGAVSPVAAAAIAGKVIHRRVREGQRLHGPGLNLNWFGIITSGIVKLLKIGTDGRQQIVGLKFPGDVLGGPLNTDKSIIIEAATDLTLCGFAQSAVRVLSEDFPEFERAMLPRLFEELDRVREWMFVLGRSTAQERVASLLNYLVRMSEVAAGTAVSMFHLPLSREEMADCLGLRIETVSRQLGQLKAHRVIAIEKARKVRILDRAALGQLVSSNS